MVQLRATGVDRGLASFFGKQINLFHNQLIAGSRMCSNNLAKARALLHGAKMAMQFGIQDIHIEGGSQIITSSLISKKAVS